MLVGLLSASFFMQLLFVLLSFTLLSAESEAESMDDFEFSRVCSYSTVKLRRGQKELTFNIEDVMVSTVNTNTLELCTSTVCMWGGGKGSIALLTNRMWDIG